MKFLLLSNMFPDKNNPTYGTFVKSSYDQLKRIIPVVDKIVMFKNNGSWPDKIKKYFCYYVKAIKEINRNDYDAIYIHYIAHSSIPALISKKKFKIISNIHGTDIFPKRIIQKMLLPIVRVIISKSDLIIVPSEYIKKYVECKYRVNKQKIFVSPSGGINSAIFFPSKRNRYSNHTSRIGYASRIEINKGWDTYIEAISILRENEFNFSLVGSGACKRELYHMINEKKLHGKIDLKESLPQAHLREYFSSLDCFVFPSENESLGLIGIEAMACGCPVIGANNSGITSYLEDGYNGLIFEPGNPEELAKKIENYFLLEEEEKRKMSLNAIETAKKYDSVIVEKQLESRLESLMRHA